MNPEQQKAYEWAKNQNYQSVAAQYAKILADLIYSLQADLARVTAERDAAVADMKSITDAAREKYCDDICCFACAYDADFSITDSGTRANECPGFDRDDCFKWRGAHHGKA